MSCFFCPSQVGVKLAGLLVTAVYDKSSNWYPVIINTLKSWFQWSPSWKHRLCVFWKGFLGPGRSKGVWSYRAGIQQRSILTSGCQSHLPGQSFNDGTWQESLCLLHSGVKGPFVRDCQTQLVVPCIPFRVYPGTVLAVLVLEKTLLAEFGNYSLERDFPSTESAFMNWQKVFPFTRSI